MYETTRLILRPWQASDIEPFVQLNQDPQVMEFFPGIYTVEETIEQVEKFKQHFVQHKYTMYACELKNTNEFIGFIGLMYRDFVANFTPCVEIGWRLAYKHWGQGLAVEAAQQCLNIGVNEFNLNEIVSFTAKSNLRSQRVMQKLGMTRDIKGDFHHPKLAVDDPLSLHVLYRISKEQWYTQSKITP